MRVRVRVSRRQVAPRLAPAPTLAPHSNGNPARSVGECLLDIGVGSQGDTKVSPIPSSDGFTVASLIPCTDGAQSMNRSAGVRTAFGGLAAALVIAGGIVMPYASMVDEPGADTIKPFTIHFPDETLADLTR